MKSPCNNPKSTKQYYIDVAYLQKRQVKIIFKKNIYILYYILYKWIEKLWYVLLKYIKSQNNLK